PDRRIPRAVFSLLRQVPFFGASCSSPGISRTKYYMAAHRENRGDDRPERWKIEVNDRYQKVVDVIIGLATASLVLPPFLLRTYLGVQEGTALRSKLDC